MFPQICTNSIVGHHSGTLFWYGAFLWSLKQGQSTGTPFAILSHFAPISLIWIFIFWISTKPLIIFSLFLSHLVQVCPTKKWTKRTKMGHLFKQSHFGMFICQKSWKNGAKWGTMSYYVQCMSQRSKMGQECPISERLFAKKSEKTGEKWDTMSHYVQCMSQRSNLSLFVWRPDSNTLPSISKRSVVQCSVLVEKLKTRDVRSSILVSNIEFVQYIANASQNG